LKSLLSQPFVKDDKQTVEQYLKSAKARLLHICASIGAGIEKKRKTSLQKCASRPSAAGFEAIDQLHKSRLARVFYDLKRMNASPKDKVQRFPFPFMLSCRSILIQKPFDRLR
jgi:hypothetical protein